MPIRSLGAKCSKSLVQHKAGGRRVAGARYIAPERIDIRYLNGLKYLFYF